MTINTNHRNIRPVRLPALILLTLWATVSSYSPGQVSSGTSFDLQGYIDQALAEGKTTIRIPPGRHRVEPASNGVHLTLKDLNNITIDGTGAEMICTHTTRALDITNCTNLTMIGLTIDYDPLPFTQGRIMEMSEDKRTLKITLMDGYPGSGTLSGDKLEIFDYDTEELITTTYYGVNFEADGTRGVIAQKPSNNQPENSHEKVGDIAVITSREPGKNVSHAILSTNCYGLVIKNVTLYSSNMFGFFETDCSGSRYINCVVDRRLLGNDLKPRSHRRMRSLTADAFHSKHALIGPTYLECLARYMGDDGIAINGHYHIITECNGSSLRVIGKQARIPNLSVGDPVELVSYTGERIGDAIINGIESGPALNDLERQFLEQQNLSGNVQGTRDADQVYLVTLDRAIDLPLGSLIASVNRLGNGFEIRDCTMGPNRSRGIVVKASNGIISRNRFIDNWGQAIKLSPEYAWLEAGSGSNITVSDNTISGCRDAAIAIYANGGNGSTAPAGAHNDIAVIANSISHSTNPAIAITSTRRLKLYGNTIEAPDNSGLLPWRMNSFGRNEDPSREVYLENVEDVTGAPSTMLEQWRDRHHLEQDGSEDLMDFAGDGIPALFKLAFNLGSPRDMMSGIPNLDLNDPEKGGLPLLEGNQDISYSYLELAAEDTGLQYICEYASNPTSNSWLPIADSTQMYHVITRNSIADADYELVSVFLSTNVLNSSFLRLRISTPQ